ncbi:hypothetical protein ACFL6W_10690 [Thermodesulfobacteriota bacterium]
MRENDAGDEVSGRYRHMESVSDYILTPYLEIIFNFDNPIGGELIIKPWLKYNHYHHNEKSSYPEAGIEIKQSITKNGNLSLEGQILEGYYKKNYISGFNDINGNNNITKDERKYTGAYYDEYEGLIAYDHRVMKKKDNALGIGLNIMPFAGYGVRKYNAEFDNRDRKVSLRGMEFNFDSKSKVSLNVTYKYERVDCPDGNELVLVNEESLGYDINNDGDLDRNALLFTNIKRSSKRHSLELVPSIKLGKKWLLSAGYRLRKTLYKSDNQLDLEHYGQSKYRREFKAGIEYDFLKSLSVRIEYNKLDAEDDEFDDDSYIQEGYIFSARYTFK